MNALVNQYAQLVLDALRYAQPVEVGKEQSDVVVALRTNCQACGSVDDGRQTVQVAAGQAGESDVAFLMITFTVTSFITLFQLSDVSRTIFSKLFQK